MLRSSLNRVADACPDCEPLSRRDFLKSTAAVTVASAVSLPAAAVAARKPPPPAETMVAALYKTLRPEQRAVVAFPFEHELRHEVEANWRITDQGIGKLFDADQQEMIRQIFLSIHSPEYATQVLEQVEHDNHGHGGFGGCSIALFGEPGSGKFEFVLTGRHVTRRCDGDSVEGAAFGGPIFYGHAARGFNEKPDHPGNIYWYQALRANEVFGALDGKQRVAALRTDPRQEDGVDTVKLREREASLAGVSLGELSADQRELVKKVMADVLAPFREEDRTESMKLIEAAGFENLHMAFYNNDWADIGNDRVWDVWQIEGPGMVWYFRGAPHVHTWVNISKSEERRAKSEG